MCRRAHSEVYLAPLTTSSLITQGSLEAFHACHRKNIIKMTPSRIASQKNLCVSVHALNDRSTKLNYPRKYVPSLDPGSGEMRASAAASSSGEYGMSIAERYAQVLRG